MSDEKGRPRQLGRGLEALFGEDRTDLAAAASAIDRLLCVRLLGNGPGRVQTAPSVAAQSNAHRDP